MLWKGRRESSNVEDRRRVSGRAIAATGGGLGTVILVVLYLLLGGKSENLNQVVPSGSGLPLTESRELTAAEKEQGQFVAVVLAETEDVWKSVFNSSGKVYREPRLVLFSGLSESACGMAQAAVGPFYCPADETIYMDLDFLADMQGRLGAQGDFAVAYIIAHEVGHHVQKLLGIMDRVEEQRATLGEVENNDLSVRMELQADFLAGVWAFHAQRTKNLLEEGDVEEAVNAAGAVGDDRIQRRTQGTVIPDSFTHGTSAQRTSWFLKGFRTGDPAQGDTFSAPNF